MSVKSLRKQRARKFASEFCENGFNASKAVRDLGYTNNPKSAWVIGHRLLSNVVTQRAVEEHLKQSKMSADDVLERLSKIAQTEAKFSGADVVKASELLGKGHKLFTERTETVDLTEHEGARTFIANEIASLSGDPIEREAELQRLFANKTAPNYDPKLDVNQNPLTWPSGRSLLTDNDLDPVSKAVN